MLPCPPCALYHRLTTHSFLPVSLPSQPGDAANHLPKNSIPTSPNCHNSAALHLNAFFTRSTALNSASSQCTPTNNSQIQPNQPNSRKSQLKKLNNPAENRSANKQKLKTPTPPPNRTKDCNSQRTTLTRAQSLTHSLTPPKKTSAKQVRPRTRSLLNTPTPQTKTQTTPQEQIPTTKLPNLTPPYSPPKNKPTTTKTSQTQNAPPSDLETETESGRDDGERTAQRWMSTTRTERRDESREANPEGEEREVRSTKLAGHW